MGELRRFCDPLARRSWYRYDSEMCRVVVNMLALLLFAVFVLALACWIGGYADPGKWRLMHAGTVYLINRQPPWDKKREVYCFAFEPGRLCLQRYVRTGGLASTRFGIATGAGEGMHLDRGSSEEKWESRGVKFLHQGARTRQSHSRQRYFDFDQDITIVSFPLWPILLASLPFPAVRGWMGVKRILTRRSRIRRGCCLACGYDLRATLERCPECGAVICRSDKSESGTKGSNS
jgi:hypothetical protein